MSDVGSAYHKHTEMLTTRWWTMDKFQEQGVPCREGPFSPAETQLMQDTICKYQMTKGISEEEVEDLILGPSPRDGFWENIAHGVPCRHVCAVHDHTKDLFNPYRDSQQWTDANDLRLTELVSQNLTWAEIGDAMLQSARTCRNRYNNQLVPCGTQQKGKWTAEEEARLHGIMQVMTDEGKERGPKSKFWNQVSAHLNNTRLPEQCRLKWTLSLSPEVKSCSRIHWHDTNSKMLFNKVAMLNVDAEEDINWDRLCWKTWSADKLRMRWAELKADAEVDVSMSHRDAVQHLRGHWGNTPS